MVLSGLSEGGVAHTLAQSVGVLITQRGQTIGVGLVGTVSEFTSWLAV
jgi:hypothetical protein